MKDEASRYRLLVESVSDYAIYLIDPDGIVLSWNKGAERIHGFHADEIVGRRFSIFFSPEDDERNLWQHELAVAKRDGRYEDEGWRVRKDGTRFWASVVLTAVKDDAGALVGFAKITRDLTDRNYRLFVEATSSIVWTTDAGGRPIGDSPTWRAFTGQSRDDWFGLKAWEPIHPDDAPDMRVAWPKAKEEKRPFAAEFRLRRFDGEYVWMGCRALPLTSPDGVVRQWLGVTFDISARKKAELERAEALERERSARVEAEGAREWWTTTLRSIGDAVIATDTSGRVTFVNPIAASLTGWSPSEAMGRLLTDVFVIVHEETRRRVEHPVARVLREGRIVGLANHTVLVRRDGTDVPIDDSAAPIRDAEGNLLGVVLVFRDVTAEKRAQAQRDFLARAGDALVGTLDYRESLSTLAQLAVPRLADWCAVDVMEPGSEAPQQLAVAHVDPAKIAFARQLGRRYPPDPNATTGVPAVIRSGRSEIYPTIPAEMLEAGAQDAEHLRLIRELSLRSAMVVPLRGRESTFGALTFIFAESGRQYSQDDLAFAEELARRAAIVIERRRLEEEREALLERERAARAEAEVANRAKDEFLATISHELRTPLNAILGWTVTIQSKPMGQDVARALTIIERNARAQARLIEDVLDVSRIISGKLRLDFAAIDPREPIEAATEAVRHAAEAKHVTLAATVDPDLGHMVADADRLQQIVWNLLANGVKFTQDGGHVWLDVQRLGAILRITVRDDGKGIEPRLLGAIFEPFRQADSSTTRQHGGLGLGLAIVRQLVHAHGGHVRASSQGEGRGAEFVVELPARASIPAPRAAGRMPVPLAQRSTASMRGLRVLVVDDEEDARTLVGTLLGERGASVQLAASAGEAFGRVRTFRPDVLVSDIAMPNEDGYSLLRRIRALGASEGGRTPALALTAYARGDDAERAFSAGFQMHVAKPFEPDELVAAVAHLAGLPTD